MKMFNNNRNSISSRAPQDFANLSLCEQQRLSRQRPNLDADSFRSTNDYDTGEPVRHSVHGGLRNGALPHQPNNQASHHLGSTFCEPNAQQWGPKNPVPERPSGHNRDHVMQDGILGEGHRQGETLDPRVHCGADRKTRPKTCENPPEDSQSKVQQDELYSLALDDTLFEPLEAPSKGKGIQIRNAFITYFPVDSEGNSYFFPKSFTKSFLQVASCQKLYATHPNVSFQISSLEICPSTGRLHGHIYVEFTCSKTVSQIKTIFKSQDLKVFARKGTQQQAIDYIYKVGKYADKAYTRLGDWLEEHGLISSTDNSTNYRPIIYGVPKKQGARSDLDRYVEMAFDGVQRNEFLASERGAGLRYLRYFSDACSIVDGLDRNDIARANKRVAYEQYLEECDKTGEIPIKYFQFKVGDKPDFSFNPASAEHYAESATRAYEAHEEMQELHKEGILTKAKATEGVYDTDELAEEKTKKESAKESVSDDDDEMPPLSPIKK